MRELGGCFLVKPVARSIIRTVLSHGPNIEVLPSNQFLSKLGKASNCCKMQICFIGVHGVVPLAVFVRSVEFEFFYTVPISRNV